MFCSIPDSPISSCTSSATTSKRASTKSYCATPFLPFSLIRICKKELYTQENVLYDGCTHVQGHMTSESQVILEKDFNAGEVAFWVILHFCGDKGQDDTLPVVGLYKIITGRHTCQAPLLCLDIPPNITNSKGHSGLGALRYYCIP